MLRKLRLRQKEWFYYRKTAYEVYNVVYFSVLKRNSVRLKQGATDET